MSQAEGHVEDHGVDAGELVVDEHEYDDEQQADKRRHDAGPDGVGAQARSNRAPGGRKSDLADAKRLVRRFVAGELYLSFVPDPEQRSWRTVTRARLQLIRERAKLQNQIESLLEEGRIKLSSVISVYNSSVVSLSVS